jgi:hypothetical protein
MRAGWVFWMGKRELPVMFFKGFGIGIWWMPRWPRLNGICMRDHRVDVKMAIERVLDIHV